MKSFVITLKDSEKSNYGADNLIKSAPFPVEKYNAITPNQVDKIMAEHPFTWTWPWTKERLDINSGLKLHPYLTAEPKKRIACFLSHYFLWNKCVNLNKPMFIFEHDAIFIKKTLPLDNFLKSKYHIIGINHPFQATRRASVFDQMIQSNTEEFQRPPQIDDLTVPQGIAGNSAYFIKPKGAKKMLELTDQHGCWPNDALMCRQLIPLLGVSKTYYTKTQRLGSTTTL